MSMYDVDYFKSFYKFKEAKAIFGKMGMELDVKKLNVPVLTLSKDDFHSTHDAFILKHLEFNNLVKHIYLKHQNIYIENKIQEHANG